MAPFPNCQRLLAVVAVLCTLAPPLRAATLTDARITEFLADNQDGIQDGDGDTSDWIEIWNSSGIAGDLGGWHLTDDPADLTKWTFPAVELSSSAYLVVFASGKDRTDPAADLHTNFRLGSSAGGYLALVKPDGVTIASEYSSYPEQLADIAYGAGFQTAQPVTLIETGDPARWHIPTGPVADWNTVGFDDTGWSSGATGIGYDNPSGTYSGFFGAGDDFRTAMRGNNTTAYIRIAFEVPDPAGITDLILSALWEDGFIAYLNGAEIHRERAPASPAWDSSSDPPTGRLETDAIVFFDYPLASGNLIAGTNVLAIHGLNDSQGSSDFLFSPRLTGTQQDVINLVDGYFPDTTPGTENTTRFDGITADTKFSTDRGLHETAFDLTITSATPDAIIRYTTDGTPPSESHGTTYADPITVSETTVIRAMAYKLGFHPTNVDTHTYIFPTDVASQPPMRTVIGGVDYSSQIPDALRSIPTIALSFEGTDVPLDRSEIPTSVELLNFEGSARQLDAGVARFGSFVTNFAKRSMRLHFRSAYGPSRLDYPLFDGTDYNIPPTEDFDSLDLRAGNHDMIHRGAYLSNRFTDDSMIEMGNIAPHGRFVHLYFNGQYRGQYHLRERWNAAMLADYFPGKEEEFDTINANNTGSEFLTGDLQDGDLADWDQIQSLLAGPTPYASVRDMLDVPNLIDFMLLWTTGNSESEFRAGGSVANGVGFKFLIKDADGYLRTPAANHAVTHNGPLNAMTRFRTEGDPDFQILLADRIHKHYFNDGALTPERNIARLQNRVDETQLSFIAESARWEMHTNRTNHTPPQWLSYQNNLINNQFPNRTADQIAKLRAAGMYPDIIAPVLSQHGGSIPPGAGITMSTGATAIYYTLDGSDPRLPGGAISPDATLAPFEGEVPEPQDFISTGDSWKYLDDGSDQGTAWRAPAFDDDSWAAGPSELGYGDSIPEATVVGFIDADPVASGTQRNATTYFRHKVNITSPSSFSYFSLNLRYDDGAAVYANGNEVVRTDNLPANAAYDTYADGSTPSEKQLLRVHHPEFELRCRREHHRRRDPQRTPRQLRHQLRPAPARRGRSQQRQQHHPTRDPHPALRFQRPRLQLRNRRMERNHLHFLQHQLHARDHREPRHRGDPLPPRRTDHPRRNRDLRRPR